MTRILASGSPKPGTGRAQYVSSRKRATFSRATSSRHATSRGHLLHSTISAVGPARSAARVIGLLQEEPIEPPLDDDEADDAHHGEVDDAEQERRVEVAD